MKKTFKDSPTLNFISKPVQDTEPSTSQITAPSTPIPEGYKLNPLYVEKRTRRVQLVLQPSLYEKVKKVAEKKGISFNDYVHVLLEEAVRTEE